MTRLLRASALVAAASLGVAAASCKSPPNDRATRTEPTSSSAPPPPSSSPSAATALPPNDASRPSSHAARETSLFDLVPAKVAVSSAVHNPRDFPEHLVDGRLSTAWNSRTGDLVGAWIAFRVPKDARVRHIAMTAGFDKVSGTVDLFTANHRITKIALSRDGTRISEHALDPSVRGMQTIPVDGPGGDYEVRVLATLPGTKTGWRELVVSEFLVVGKPGKERRKDAKPMRVAVGGLDKPVDDLSTEDVSSEVSPPAKDLATLCATFIKRAREQLPALRDRVRAEKLDVGEPTCAETKLTPAFAPVGSFREARALRLFDGVVAWNQLVVGYSAGLALLPVSWGFDDPLDPGCPSIVRVDGLRGVRVENGNFLAVTDGHRMIGETVDEELVMKRAPAIGAVWCKDQGATLRCSAHEASRQESLGAFAIAPHGTLRRQD